MHKQYIFFAWFKTLYKWHHTIAKQLAFFAQFLLFLMKVSNTRKNKKIVITPMYLQSSLMTNLVSIYINYIHPLLTHPFLGTPITLTQIPYR